MRTLFIFLLCFVLGNLLSQEVIEKTIKSKVSGAIVFLEGAQITRKKTVDLVKGKTMLKFTDLSPFIDAKSIQIKAKGALTVLTVNHQQNYLDKIEKSKELDELVKRLEAVEGKIKLENTHLSIIQEELAFLYENRDIGGKNEQVNITNLQQASEFYRKKLTSLKMAEIERNKTLKELNIQKTDLQKQIRALSGKKEFPAGEILVKADVKKAGRFTFELSYIVGNAGWFPSYDIRAKNINEPVMLIYKANVRQDTKVDWNNIKLKFSSAAPNVSGVAPELLTYYLNYNTMPPTYKRTTNSVRGRVMDNNGTPIPGANIVVVGTTIGTVTDLDGNYSITIPNSSSRLKFSFIGYVTRTLPVSGAVMNITLNEDMVGMDEVAVVGYGTKKKMARMAMPSAKEAPGEKSELKIRGIGSLAIPTAQVEKQTTVDFEIRTPYTIKSDNKNYKVDMESYNLPAFFQYYCVPKIDKDAFLIANIVDWEKYNLLEGEANVFFEDTYVGKTLMDIRYASDTLEISLGRDKNISVNREKIKDFTSKQFIGNKKEETRAWKTTVKNNKTKEINMTILDQVPVSTIEEIEVNVQDISGAKHDTETGEIKWEFKLSPGSEKKFDLKYSVKYPKHKNLIVE